MKSFSTMLSFLLLVTDCGLPNKDIDCKSDKKFKFDEIEVLLPSCYELFYPDSIERNYFYLVQKDSIKLTGLTGGLASVSQLKEPEKHPSLTFSTDTISNSIRRIGFEKNGTGYRFFVNIYNLKIAEKSMFDLDKDTSTNSLKDYKLYVRLTMSTNDKYNLSKIEAERLFKAFKNSEVIED